VYGAIDAVSDTPGNHCDGPSVAVMAKRACSLFIGWTQPLDVETFSYIRQKEEAAEKGTVLFIFL
jgi:hypothetical protein